jgi:catechol 2,3-dioxygenase-like lactoylglutathione lyase family enzyme
MFSSARLQTLICTTDIERAAPFYSDALGLTLIAREHGALVYDVGGQPLRVSPVSAHEPSAHTVVGFAVRDLDAAIRRLRSSGIELERFPGMPHDDTGVVRLRDRARVAWFRDPDGNILSVVEYAQ